MRRYLGTQKFPSANEHVHFVQCTCSVRRATELIFNTQVTSPGQSKFPGYMLRFMGPIHRRRDWAGSEIFGPAEIFASKIF